MITIRTDSTMTARPWFALFGRHIETPRARGGLVGLKACATESLLVVGVLAFWMVALPFAVVVVLPLKVWDAMVAPSRVHPPHPAPAPAR